MKKGITIKLKFGRTIIQYFINILYVLSFKKTKIKMSTVMQNHCITYYVHLFLFLFFVYFTQHMRAHYGLGHEILTDYIQRKTEQLVWPEGLKLARICVHLQGWRLKFKGKTAPVLKMIWSLCICWSMFLSVQWHSSFCPFQIFYFMTKRLVKHLVYWYALLCVFIVRYTSLILSHAFLNNI